MAFIVLGAAMARGREVVSGRDGGMKWWFSEARRTRERDGVVRGRERSIAGGLRFKSRLTTPSMHLSVVVPLIEVGRIYSVVLHYCRLAHYYYESPMEVFRPIQACKNLIYRGNIHSDQLCKPSTPNSFIITQPALPLAPAISSPRPLRATERVRRLAKGREPVPSHCPHPRRTRNP